MFSYALEKLWDCPHWPLTDLATKILEMITPGHCFVSGEAISIALSVILDDEATWVVRLLADVEGCNCNGLRGDETPCRWRYSKMGCLNLTVRCQHSPIKNIRYRTHDMNDCLTTYPTVSRNSEVGRHPRHPRPLAGSQRLVIWGQQPLP